MNTAQNSRTSRFNPLCKVRIFGGNMLSVHPAADGSICLPVVMGKVKAVGDWTAPAIIKLVQNSW